MSDNSKELLGSISQIPEGQKLLTYLQRAAMMPTVAFEPLPPSVLGGFIPGNTDNPIGGKTGFVAVSQDLRGPGGHSPAAETTLLHELTHAAQRQMQRSPGPKTKEASAKLDPTTSKLRPKPENSGQEYRLHPKEMQAFGIGNSVKPSGTFYSGAPHLDATMAQEFMILLDIAMREQAAKKATK